MIIITGAAGFIGSNLAKKLNSMGYTDLLLVDDIKNLHKKQNIDNIIFNEIIGINEVWGWFKKNNSKKISVIFHLGACSDTLEKDGEFLYKNNVLYSQKLWKVALDFDCKFIYASSAATYGDGSLGFSDNVELISKLKPLNLYGKSKQTFDLWILEQKEKPKSWIGLKYFNVFGPGESHKGRMASVVWHFVQQIAKGQSLKLFGSSHGFKPGEQKRDFIYIEDAIEMTLYGFINDIKSGIYNIGTGEAKSFNFLAENLIKNFPGSKIAYIPFPNNLKNYYQSYTCADMTNFNNCGFSLNTMPLTKSIDLYINTLKTDEKN